MVRCGAGLQIALKGVLILSLLPGCEALQGETPCARDEDCQAGFRCDLAAGLCQEIAGTGTDAAVIDAAHDAASQDAAAGADAAIPDRAIADSVGPDLRTPDSGATDLWRAPDAGDQDLDATQAVDQLGQDGAPEDSGTCTACSAELPICGPGNTCVQCTGPEHCNGRPCNSVNVCVECTLDDHCNGGTCVNGFCSG